MTSSTSLPSSSPYLLSALLLLLPFLATPYLTSYPLPREQVIKPDQEYVLILGGSEGCGKGLAEEYVLRRNARVYVLDGRVLARVHGPGRYDLAIRPGC
jgi:hypothetical protein